MHPLQDSTVHHMTCFVQYWTLVFIAESLHPFKEFTSTQMMAGIRCCTPVSIAESLRPFKDSTSTLMTHVIDYRTPVSIFDPQRPLKDSTVNSQDLCHSLLNTCDHFRIFVFIAELRLYPNDLCRRLQDSYVDS